MAGRVIDYYDKIAGDYDESRFGNTYGKFIDGQERRILKKLLGKTAQPILDMGCGTGRLLDFADSGIDASAEMLEHAKAKFPVKTLKIADAKNTGFDANTFNAVFSFHVFMHLNKADVEQIFDEAYRILKTGGRFIFDVPSKKRRQLVNFKSEKWHGANAYSVNEIKNLCEGKWILKSYNGIMFLPIHRMPVFTRKKLLVFDNLLTVSPLKKYSSYLVFELQKI